MEQSLPISTCIVSIRSQEGHGPFHEADSKNSLPRTELKIDIPFANMEMHRQFNIQNESDIPDIFSLIKVSVVTESVRNLNLKSQLPLPQLR